jgi:ADP-ribosylglycohydrolase
MIITIIKPTKYNRAILLKRGLYSDDSEMFFKLYESLYQNKAFICPDDQWFLKELDSAKLKY